MTELIREKAYHELRDMITHGDLKPGEKLVETTLCKKLEISRTPLREAIRQLQMEGYVDAMDQKGVVVHKITAEDVDAVYDISSVLEGLAVERAAVGIKPADLKKLEKIYKDHQKTRKRRAESSEIHEKTFQLNTAFHLFFAERCENPVLKKEIFKFRRITYRSRYLIMSFADSDELDYHGEILKAVKEKNAAKAGGLMVKHIRDKQKHIVAFLKNNRWF